MTLIDIFNLHIHTTASFISKCVFLDAVIQSLNQSCPGSLAHRLLPSLTY